MNNDICPCGTEKKLMDCCGPYLYNGQNPATAEILMRSRYTAYCRKEINYLVESTHSTMRQPGDDIKILQWANACTWESLIIETIRDGKSGDNEGYVQFKAFYFQKGQRFCHEENSHFVKEDGKWKFVCAV